jgi:uncharacterized MAPEG superfamily protein
MTNTFHFKEDAYNALGPVFKLALVCFGPCAGKPMVEKLEKLEKNCAENEPYFVGLSLVGATLLGGCSTTALLVKTYMWARIAHAWFFVTSETFGTAPRSLCWTVGAFTQLGFGAMVLKSIANKYS